MSPEDDINSGHGLSYKKAGVDIDTGAALVRAIKPLAKGTARAGATGTLGGFGGLFDLRAAGYRDPILVAGTDGVGTKLMLAIASGRHQEVGVDLVAMCVNDVIVQGARPLFFLDYYATGRLELETGRSILAGIARGCREAGCALIGGETAEMPGLYAVGDYDLAGFCVGAAERDDLLTGEGIEPGDLVLGLASTGLHSNGFSLVRRIVADQGLDTNGPAPFAPETSLGEALLVPTRIYVESCLAALAAGGVKAFAHITGGGLIENLPRMLPDEVAIELEPLTWPIPEVFSWLLRAGQLSVPETLRTFNCGIGMALVTAPERAEALSRLLVEAGESVHIIGRIVERPAGGPGLLPDPKEIPWPG